jgi:hypothetical protein
MIEFVSLENEGLVTFNLIADITELSPNGRKGGQLKTYVMVRVSKQLLHSHHSRKRFQRVQEFSKSRKCFKEELVLLDPVKPAVLVWITGSNAKHSPKGSRCRPRVADELDPESDELGQLRGKKAISSSIEHVSKAAHIHIVGKMNIEGIKDSAIQVYSISHRANDISHA